MQQQRDQPVIQSAFQQPPKTYFHLIERVGSTGKYQRTMLLIFMLCWFVTGTILFSAPFLFRSRKFDCPASGLLVPSRNCLAFVCKLPQKQWPNFFGAVDNSHTSIATSHNYLCKQQVTIDFLSSCTYFGALIGYFLISFLADNFGRRLSLLVSWSLCTLGSIIVAASVNIYIIAVGLALSGCGCDAAINITLCYFAQTVGNRERQKYSVIVQMFFTVGALAMTFFFYVIDNWRINWCFLVVAPSLLTLVLISMYIQETPQFLMKHNLITAMETLNRIGKINLDRRQTLQQQDLDSVMQHQLSTFQKKYMSVFDLLKFRSLRKTTIVCIVLATMISAMYYGPALIISDIGFDIYVNNLIIQLPQLIIFLPAFLCIEHIQRVFFGKIIFLILVLTALVLAFTTQPHCDLCLSNIIGLIMIFLFRGCIALYYAFFQIYCYEIFPSRIRGVGFGAISAIGALAAAINPIYIGFSQRNGANVTHFFGFFAFFAIIAFGCLNILPQTKGINLVQQIQQIEQKKHRQKHHKLAKGNKFFNRKYKSQLSSGNSLNDIMGN